MFFFTFATLRRGERRELRGNIYGVRENEAYYWIVEMEEVNVYPLVNNRLDE